MLTVAGSCVDSTNEGRQSDSQDSARQPLEHTTNLVVAQLEVSGDAPSPGENRFGLFFVMRGHLSALPCAVVLRRYDADTLPAGVFQDIQWMYDFRPTSTPLSNFSDAP